MKKKSKSETLTETETKSKPKSEVITGIIEKAKDSEEETEESIKNFLKNSYSFQLESVQKTISSIYKHINELINFIDTENGKIQNDKNETEANTETKNQNETKKVNNMFLYMSYIHQINNFVEIIEMKAKKILEKEISRDKEFSKIISSIQEGISSLEFIDKPNSDEEKKENQQTENSNKDNSQEDKVAKIFEKLNSQIEAAEKNINDYFTNTKNDIRNCKKKGADYTINDKLYIIMIINSLYLCEPEIQFDDDISLFYDCYFKLKPLMDRCKKEQCQLLDECDWSEMIKALYELFEEKNIYQIISYIKEETMQYKPCCQWSISLCQINK